MGAATLSRLNPKSCQFVLGPTPSVRPLTRHACRAPKINLHCRSTPAEPSCHTQFLESECDTEPCCSTATSYSLSPTISSLAKLSRATGVTVVVSSVMLPLTALAARAGEAAPPGFMELLLNTVDSLGPWGPIGFIVLYVVCEMVPFFPSTPLALASGALFGTQSGALCMLLGTTAASGIAFWVSRGIGRPLAERIIKTEMAGASGPIAKLSQVTDAIERGSFVQQAGAVLALRLTPVVPFSVSNYILGLSPLPFLPYLTGTLAGMTIWSVVYASVGSASRSLLRSGANPDQIIADVMAKAGCVTESTAAVVAGVGVAAAVAAFMYTRSSRQGQQHTQDPSSEGSRSSMDEVVMRDAADMMEHSTGSKEGI